MQRHQFLTSEISLTAFPIATAHYKCNKILKTFLVQFSNKILVIKAGIHKMLVRIANREDPDQTSSSKAV